MTNKEIITRLKELQKNRPNIGVNLTLYSLINLFIRYFKEKGIEE
jgi:hypothetical protein